MLFSNPTAVGSRRRRRFIQGDADAPEDLTSMAEEFGVERAQLLFERQPVGITMIGVMPGPVRKLADWYAWRVFIHVRPRRIRWWADGDPGRLHGEVVV